MTYTDVTPSAADHRRAAALVLHYGTRNEAGQQAVIAETAETGRPTQLILALLGLYDALVPEVRTELGMKLMGQQVMRLAGLEEDERQ